jgi:site-specific DNA recombinase
METVQAASYARVSSDQQVEANTVASQIAALRARVAADGLALPEERQFVDEGYSGATLIRPALEQLRDLVAVGGVDRLYVHSPDRLARKYAYQVLLIDEFQRAGVEVIFLHRELGRSPEDELLLQVQGMVAEYERAKILERSRRGKRHAAQSGEVSGLSTAPYGYLYIRKQDSGGVGRFEIVLEEARVVRQVFAWIGRDRLSIGEVVRRLNAAGERTRTGKTVWDRTTVWGMLKNPAYMGQAAFGKTRVGPLQPRLRAQRGGSLQPRRASSPTDVPADEWISIPIPALVREELFTAVQGQLEENRRRARQGQRGARYLLQGLVLCQQCGYAYYGKAISPSSRKGNPRDYAYYRCIGMDAYRFGGERICRNTQVRTDLLDLTVWQEVCALLEDPQRVEQEYQRRLAPPEENERSSVDTQLSKVRQGLARLIDSYAEGLIEKAEFEPRITRLRQRIADLEGQVRQLAQAAAVQDELRRIIGRLDTFAAQVRDGLAEADWLKRREIIRALVKRVEVGDEEVNVVFRVGADPFVERPDRGVLQHCGRRGLALTCQYCVTWAGTGDHDRLPQTQRQRHDGTPPVATEGDPVRR